MKTIYRYFVLSVVVLSFGLGARHIFGETSNAQSTLLQFNNLVITAMAGSNELVATPVSGNIQKGCIAFANPTSNGSTIDCPNPLQSILAAYHVRINTDTKLLLRTRAAAQWNDFAPGDRINVFGTYSQDNVIEAQSLRNLSKPKEAQELQLENAEVIGKIITNPKSIIVMYRPALRCYGFTNDIKKEVFCPKGIPSLPDYNRTQNLLVPDNVKSEITSVRKYELTITDATKFLDKKRNPLSFDGIDIGDSLNILGNSSGDDAQTIDAKVVRDLSKPMAGPTASSYEGIITQINAGDGSFVIRTRNGRLLTIENPIQTGNFISIKGVLDDIKGTISKVTDVGIRSLTDANAISVISKLSPGSGPLGTRITLSGTGFLPKGNSVNFAGVLSAVSNLSSDDGRTLVFTIPATPCAPQMVCTQTILAPGVYPLSVSNANGTSNEVTFEVLNAGTLSITTDMLPQAMGNTRYGATIDAVGGIDSYVWKVTNGSLPPGIILSSGVCIMAPCKISGNFSGVPTTPGTYTFTITLQSGQEKTSRDYTLVVVQPTTPIPSL